MASAAGGSCTRPLESIGLLSEPSAPRSVDSTPCRRCEDGVGGRDHALVVRGDHDGRLPSPAQRTSSASTSSADSSSSSAVGSSTRTTPGAADDRGGDGQPLLLAAGHLPGPRRRAVTETESLQQARASASVRRSVERRRTACSSCSAAVSCGNRSCEGRCGTQPTCRRTQLAPPSRAEPVGAPAEEPHLAAAGSLAQCEQREQAGLPAAGRAR